MKNFIVTRLPISGLAIIQPTPLANERAYDVQTYNALEFQEQGLNMSFVQDNQSMSTKGVLRGIHLQKKYPQGKLVRVTAGAVFDVAVDARKGSETFGKWYGIELSEHNKTQFYIPEGFAHGFLVLTEKTQFCYSVTNYYHPEDEIGFAWNDPEVGIKWPSLIGHFQGSCNPNGYSLEDGTAIKMAERDKHWLRFKETFM